MRRGDRLTMAGVVVLVTVVMAGASLLAQV